MLNLSQIFSIYSHLKFCRLISNTEERITCNNLVDEMETNRNWSDDGKIKIIIVLYNIF